MQKLRESESLRLKSEEIIRFFNNTIKQYDLNEQKYGAENNDNKTLEQWHEIFQNQADQLMAAFLSCNLDDFNIEIYKCSAILLEMSRHIKKGEI